MIYRTLFYVNIYGSYELSKTIRFLAHSVYSEHATNTSTITNYANLAYNLFPCNMESASLAIEIVIANNVTVTLMYCGFSVTVESNTSISD